MSGDPINAALAAQAARQGRADLTRRVRLALSRYHTAQGWPRCGQRWPQGDGERAADALIRAHPAVVHEVNS